MIIKILENGGSRLIDEVVDCRFTRAPTPRAVYLKKDCPDEKTVVLTGDAFLLNARGDTIDKFFIDPGRNRGR